MKLSFEKTLLLILFLVFPFGQLLRFDVGGNIVLHINDLIVGIIAVYYLFRLILKKEKFPQTPYAKPIVLFLSSGAFALLPNIRFLKPSEILVSSFYWFRYGAYFVLFLFFISQIEKLKMNSKKILTMILAEGVIVSLAGYVQYFLYPDLGLLSSYGWDPHYYRLVGTFLDPSFIGAILVLSFISGVYLVTLVTSPKVKKLIFIGLSIIYVALMLTYSRASYLMLLVSVFVLTVLLKKIKFYPLFLIIFVISLFLLPKHQSVSNNLAREDTIWSRIGNWGETIKTISQNPIIGIGFNSYRYLGHKNAAPGENYLESHAGSGADSSLLFVWVTAGLGGLISFLYFGKQVLRGRKGVGIVVVAGVVGLLIHSQFANSLFYPWIMEIIWLELAMITVGDRT